MLTNWFFRISEREQEETFNISLLKLLLPPPAPMSLEVTQRIEELDRCMIASVGAFWYVYYSHESALYCLHEAIRRNNTDYVMFAKMIITILHQNARGRTPVNEGTLTLGIAHLIRVHIHIVVSHNGDSHWLQKISTEERNKIFEMMKRGSDLTEIGNHYAKKFKNTGIKACQQ